MSTGLFSILILNCHRRRLVQIWCGSRSWISHPNNEPCNFYL